MARTKEPLLAGNQLKFLNTEGNTEGIIEGLWVRTHNQGVGASCLPGAVGNGLLPILSAKVGNNGGNNVGIKVANNA